MAWQIAVVAAVILILFPAVRRRIARVLGRGFTVLMVMGLVVLAVIAFSHG